jgi:hypothetical protein
VPTGLVYQLLERLQSHRLEVDAVRSRTETACAACPDNIHLLAAFLRLLRSSYTDPVTQKDIDRRIVTAMIASAEASPPMLRLLTLNDLFSDVTRKIQGIQRADLGFVPTARIPVQLLDRPAPRRWIKLMAACVCRARLMCTGGSRIAAALERPPAPGSGNRRSVGR